MPENYRIHLEKQQQKNSSVEMQLISQSNSQLHYLLTLFYAITIVTSIVCVVICAPTDAPETSDLEKSNAHTQDSSAGVALVGGAIGSVADAAEAATSAAMAAAAAEPDPLVASVVPNLSEDNQGVALHSSHIHLLHNNNNNQNNNYASVSSSLSSSIKNKPIVASKKELDYEYYYKFRNVVGEGVKRALDECRQKFKWDRWNCPLKSFQSIMNQEEYPDGAMPSNKELGLTRALISSGIVLSIVRSCSVGTNSLCSCSKNITMPLQSAELFLANGNIEVQQNGNRNLANQHHTLAAEQASQQLYRSTNQLRLATNDFANQNHDHHNSRSLVSNNNNDDDNNNNQYSDQNGQESEQQFSAYNNNNNLMMMKQQKNNKFAWAGCDEVVKLGFKVAKAYLTPPDKLPKLGSGGGASGASGGSGAGSGESEGSASIITSDASQLINAHNYEAGRQAVKRTMKRRCKCHGTSGACQMKTCWTVLPDMSEVGDYLKRQYRVAAKVGAVTAQETDATSLIQELTAIGSDKLVFADASPDYCYENKQLGINGTLGRYCSRTKHRADGSEVSRSERDSCDRLCTKCGYKIKKEKINVERQCDCRFVYCCSIECKRCPHVEETYKCVRHS